MIDLKAIRAKLYAPAGWGCEKECGRKEVEQLIEEVDGLRVALQTAQEMIAQLAACEEISDVE